jgi:signal transduction histidine kinase
MRWSVPALVAAGLALWVDALAGGRLAGDTWALLAVAALALGAGLAGRLPVVLTAGAAVSVLLAVADQVGSPGRFALADDGVFYAVVVLGPVLAGWVVGSRNRQVAELGRRTDELERHRETSLSAARAVEGERVERAVDLALAGRLRTIVDGAHRAAALAASDPAAVPSALAVVEDTARAALAELREVLGVLTPASVTGPGPGPTSTVESSGPVSRPAGRRRAAGAGLDGVDLALVLAAVPLAVETSLAGHHGPVWLNVLASLLQGAVLVVVRRRPLVGAAVAVVLGCAQTAYLTPLPPTVTFLVPGLLVPFLVGARLPRRTAVPGLALPLLGLVATTFATPAPDRAPDGLLPVAVMGVLAWWAGRTVAVREVRSVRLTDAAAALARVRDEQAHLAVAEQRAEMARELHDVGAHALTVVCLQAGAARTLWRRDPPQARTALAAVVELADDALGHLGSSLRGMATGDTALDVAALDVLAGFGRVLGLSIDIRVKGEPCALPGDVARAAFRVVQESLTNAARHAAHASVEIGLDYGGDTLEVRVSDSGPGQDPTDATMPVNGAGLGLRGMRERVEACRGELSFGPSGRGFLVRARLPLALAR